MKNLYLKEIKDYKKSFLFWSLGIIFLLLTGMSKYLGYAKADVSIANLFKGLPSGFSSFFGVSTIDLQTASGFFAIMALYLAVMLGIHAVLLGSGIVTKEETDKTAEFLYLKPISRLQALTTKLLAGLSIIIGINLVTTISSLLIVGAFNEGPSASGDVLFMMPGVFAVQLIFFVIGFTLASVLSKPKQAGRLAGAILLITFILSIFVDISSKYEWLKYFTPFKYFDPKDIFLDRSYNAVYVAISLVLVSVLIATSRRYYKNRDLDI